MLKSEMTTNKIKAKTVLRHLPLPQKQTWKKRVQKQRLMKKMMFKSIKLTI